MKSGGEAFERETGCREAELFPGSCFFSTYLVFLGPLGSVYSADTPNSQVTFS